MSKKITDRPLKKAGAKITKWTQEYLRQVELDIMKYTDETDIPIIAEFSYQSGILREQLYQYPELTYAIKRLLAKKETALERKGLEGNNTMSIFSLKQLGWRDNIELTGKDGKDIVNSIKVNIIKPK